MKTQVKFQERVKRKLSMNGWDTKEGIKNKHKMKNLVKKPIRRIQKSQIDLDFKRIMPIFKMMSALFHGLLIKVSYNGSPELLANHRCIAVSGRSYRPLDSIYCKNIAMPPKYPKQIQMDNNTLSIHLTI